MRFRIMTEKDGVWVNGRIELTKKDAYLRNGRLGFGQKNKQTKTNKQKISPPLVHRWRDSQIEFWQKKMGFEQTVE